MVSGFNHIDFGNNFDIINSVEQPIHAELAAKLDDAANNKKIIYLTGTTIQGYNISVTMNSISSVSFSSSVYDHSSRQILHIGFEKKNGTWYFKFDFTN